MPVRNQAATPVSTPASAARRSMRMFRARQPINATANGTPTHQVKPPSPMAIIDMGLAKQSSHQKATYPSLAAINPQNTASNNTGPASLGETSSPIRLATARVTSQASRMAATTPTTLMENGPTLIMGYLLHSDG